MKKMKIALFSLLSLVFAATTSLSAVAASKIEMKANDLYQIAWQSDYYVRTQTESENEFLNRIPSQLYTKNPDSIKELIEYLNSEICQNLLSDSLYGYSNVKYQYSLTFMNQEKNEETGDEIDYYTPMLIEIEYDSNNVLDHLYIGVDTMSNSYTSDITNMSDCIIVELTDSQDSASIVLEENMYIYESTDWNLVSEHQLWRTEGQTNDSISTGWGVTTHEIAAYSTLTAEKLTPFTETIDDGEWQFLFERIVDGSIYFTSAIANDQINPVISGTNKTVANDLELTEDELLALFTYSDNMTTLEKIRINIVSNEYSDNWNKPGTYTVTAEVIDLVGNSSTATGTIIVEDVINPTISGINKVIGNNFKLTEDGLKALFTVSDDSSQLESLYLEIVEDNYTTNYSIPGNYSLKARVIDAGGNYAEALSFITVYDSTSPTIFGYTLEVSKGHSIPEEELLSYFKISDDITKIDNLTISLLMNNYSSNYQKLGNYTITACVTDEIGNSAEAEALIKVVENPQQDEPIYPGMDKDNNSSDKVGVLEQIYNNFINAYNDNPIFTIVMTVFTSLGIISLAIALCVFIKKLV